MLHNRESGVYNITYIYIYICILFICECTYKRFVCPISPELQESEYLYVCKSQSSDLLRARRAMNHPFPRDPINLSDDEQGVSFITETKRLVFRFFNKTFSVSVRLDFLVDWKGWVETNQPGLNLVNQTSYEKFWGCPPPSQYITGTTRMFAFFWGIPMQISICHYWEGEKPNNVSLWTIMVYLRQTSQCKRWIKCR